MAATAGGFYAVGQLGVTPAAVFGMLVSAQALTVAMFGGVGTVWGPVIGAVVLVPLGAFLDAEFAEVLPGIQGVIYGVAIISVILLAPEGLFWKVRDRWQRRAPAARLARGSGDDAVGAGAGGALGAGAVGALGALGPTAADAAEAADPGAGGAGAAAARFAVSSTAAGDAPILEVRGLAKSYGGLKAVDDVSLTVRRGEILGLIGPNGAGKTTLFNLMNGLTPPARGTVRFDGVELRGARPSAICRHGVGRTFQVVKPFRRMTLAANVVVGAFVRTRHDGDARALAAGALAVVGLTRDAERLAGGATNLELRLMELARALASQPKLLLLDEIFAGLASTEVERVMDVIRRLAAIGITIVIIEHTMQAMVKLVDRFVVLDHGAVLATGTPEAITRNRKVIEAYLGKKWADGTAGIEHVADA
jgi:branched-chain amino acid transport system permease protein